MCDITTLQKAKKCKNNRTFREMLKEALELHGKIKEFKDISVFIDADPVNII